ncbi:hypothetical protein [Meiothermus cerbereus]|uniref:hypothetical protein n=1 Tax=Meiothermus cerbereus TaxID=65552 RepID=UPI00047FC534|nr:hypothetical protein [Meiothermus cerbereus]
MDLESIWAAGRQEEGLSWCLQQLSHSNNGIYARYALEFALELAEETALARLLASDCQNPDFQALKSQLYWQRGRLREALELAQQAYQQHPSFLTAYALGTAVALRSAQEAEGWLKEALRLAEATGQLQRSVQAAAALALLQISQGAYAQAEAWAQWGLRLAEHLGLAHPAVLNTLRLALGHAQILGGRLLSMPALDLRQPDALLAQGDFLLALGDPEAALEAYTRLDQQLAPVRPRRLPILARKVRVLLELKRIEEALQIGREAQALSEGTLDIFRDWGELAYLLPLALVAPSEAVTPLYNLLNRLKERPSAPRSAMAALYLAQAYLRLGLESKAKSVLQEAGPVLENLSPSGRAFLAGPAHVFEEVFSLLRPQSQLRLHFLGKPTAWLGSDKIGLSPRQQEITVGLVVNPDGLSAEGLALWVWGELGRPELARAEIRRLRRKLPLQARPYRLATVVWADFLVARERLLQKDLAGALSLYRAPLLPGSEAPGVVELREELWNVLKQALCDLGTPEQIYEMALQENDPELWHLAIERLPRADPRWVLSQARLARFLAAE